MRLFLNAVGYLILNSPEPEGRPRLCITRPIAVLKNV